MSNEMKKQSIKFLHRLDEWFDSQKRVLPWRNSPSFYRVWISEIMLQQTQVATVIPYFERFVAKFPTVESLAQASLEDVLLLWSGLGYYSRARNLHRGAQMIVGKRTGRVSFPATREEWLKIPGVGNYTAGAILSIAGNQPEAILDGNVERVLSRVKLVDRVEGDAAYKAMLWKISREWVELAYAQGIQPSNLNQALMELGATVCSLRNPNCPACPLQETCQAKAEGLQDQFPPKKKPKEWIPVEEHFHCVVSPRGEVLLRLREGSEWRSGLWDLLEESPQKLLGGKILLLGQVESKHVVTRHKIRRTTSVWRASGGELAGSRAQLRWVSLDRMDVPAGSALKKTLQKVVTEFPVEIVIKPCKNLPNFLIFPSNKTSNKV
jgi:A/G-specific adenine glycosylase